jgi:quercetin dioxygenase-like cupin family protein
MRFLPSCFRGAIVLSLLGVALPAAAQVKPLLDNDRVHIRESTIKLGFKTPEHTHPANEAIYVLNGGKVKVTLADGTTRIAELKTGELMWRSTPETHTAENIGDTEIRLLTIPLKVPQEHATAASMRQLFMLEGLSTPSNNAKLTADDGVPD